MYRIPQGQRKMKGMRYYFIFWFKNAGRKRKNKPSFPEKKVGRPFNKVCIVTPRNMDENETISEVVVMLTYKDDGKEWLT